MSEPNHKSKTGFRWLVAVLGIALLTYLISRTGPRALWTNVRAVGYGLIAVIALGGLTHLVKTAAWRKTFTCDISHLSWPRSFGMRLVSEAIGQFGIAGKIVGEGTRVSLLGSAVPIVNGIAAAALDTGFYVVTSVSVAIVALVISLVIAPLPAGFRLYAFLFAGASTAMLIGLAVGFAKGWRLLGPSFQALGRLPGCKDWVSRRQPTIDATELNMLNFHRDAPKAFWSALGLNFLAHGLALSEIYVILRCLTPGATMLGALVLEGLTKLINGIGVINPGNVGTYEAGNILITKMFGVSAAAGLTLALCRRARALFWAAIGVICLTTMRRSEAAPNKDQNSGISRPDEEGAMDKQLQSSSDHRYDARAVIIVAAEEQSQGYLPSLAEVGTLPLLLRNILSVQACQPDRIIVCGSVAFTQTAQSTLMQTRRLPQSVEWCMTQGGELAQLITEVGTTSNGVVLIRANGSYQPKVLNEAFAWNGIGTLALASSGELAGVYVISRASARQVAVQFRSTEQFESWAQCYEGVERRDIPAESWHRVLAPNDLDEAERKLEGWLVKPTDGIFARMNRRISIPISRQLIKFPITPNMVTFFVLGVSLASGAFYMRGGYWNILVASLLGVAGSILDGCDGEVARMKLQSSRLGCWLDTVCDYIYYVVAFGGMAVGLARSSGSQSYYSWGAALLFGAVTMFGVASMTRQRLSGANPEKVLAVWQKKAESRSSNPLMYIGRHTEFIIRRCFLPYFLLFVALVNGTKFIFMAGAIAANLAWFIALYSYFDFSRTSHPVEKSAAVIVPEATA